MFNIYFKTAWRNLMRNKVFSLINAVGLTFGIWMIFLVAGLIAVVIALLTISFQSIKAAIANPVKSLRTE